MKLKGILIAALSSIIFGSSGLIQRPLYLENVNPLNVLTCAYFVGSITLFIYILAKKGKASLALPKKSILSLIVHSIFGTMAVTISYAFSVKYLDVSISTMLLYTYPVLISIYSIVVLKEYVSKIKILSIVGTLFGSMLVLNIFSGSKAISTIGLIIGIFSAFAYAFLSIYGDKMLKFNIEPIVIVFYNNVITLCGLLIINNQIFSNINDLTPKVVISAALLSILCQIIPMSLLYIAIGMIGPVLTSIVTTVEIPAAAILSFLVLNEQLSLVQWTGIIIVLLCLILLKMEKPKIIKES
ncbi:MAG: DMT family transporter [Clostridium sp.]|uniref:DMT family transporter n=1 Tax=Clostridium sp. TaxID=1506 RepID=UPI002FC71AB9